MKLKNVLLKGLVYSSIICFLSGVGLLFLSYFYKDKIINTTVEFINSQLDTKIEISPEIDVSIFNHFPQLTIKFKNVRIFENKNVGSKELATIEEISGTFDIYNIINSKYIVDKIFLKNGFIQLHIDEKGNVNYNILKTSNNKTEKPLQFALKSIIIINIKVIYDNILSTQHHEVNLTKAVASLEKTMANYHIHLKTDAIINEININQSSFFKNKKINTELSITLNQNKEELFIKSETCEIENANFSLSGTFKYGKPRFIDCSIEEKNGTIHTLLSLVPQKFTEELKEYQSDGNIYFTAKIKGEIRNNLHPIININFGLKNTTIFHPKINKKIKDVHLIGYFTNGYKRNSETSVLRLEDISLIIDQQKITGNVSLSNFKDIYLKFDTKGLINSSFIQEFYPINDITQLNGKLDVNINFAGKIKDFKNTNNPYAIKAEGEITLQDINLKHKKIPFPIYGLNGIILFNNRDISLSSFNGRTEKSDFNINALLKNAVSNIVFHKNNIVVSAELKSDHLDINELINENNHKTTEVQNTTTKAAQKSNSNRLDYAQLKLIFDVKKMNYNKFELTNINGESYYQKDKLYLENTSFDFAKGTVHSSGNINWTANQSIEIRTISKISKIKIDSLFHVFNNFGQSFITEKNITGELSGTIDALFELNSENNIISNTAIANIDAQINNGALHHFEPLSRLSKFIDLQKLEHITFSELQNKIFIENNIVHIPEMNIQSNVSELNISGTHSFNQDMDYRLVLPLNSLHPRKRDSDEAFGAILPDKRGNPKLHLTIKGNAENYKIAYDKQRTQAKIKEELKKEKQEFLQAFKKREKEINTPIEKPKEEPSYFDFGE
ncbi:MAG: hypothetical protein EAZ07_03625 [Cytophagales bacterium]|nr:MAG: hypothetical protein EAZ07_03625 [Cytophagales bacterium]